MEPYMRLSRKPDITISMQASHVVPIGRSWHSETFLEVLNSSSNKRCIVWLSGNPVWIILLSERLSENGNLGAECVRHAEH